MAMYHHFQMDSDTSWSLRIPMDDDSPRENALAKNALYPLVNKQKTIENCHL
jgi:hypothetical protein